MKKKIEIYQKYYNNPKLIFCRPFLVATVLIRNVCSQESNGMETNSDSIYIGPCVWIFSRKCPDDDVKFYLFTSSNPEDRQRIHVDDTWEKSNISTSYYDPKFPVKVIIHGYNSDMQLTPLIDMKKEYLHRGQYNLFFVDWSVLGPAPCELINLLSKDLFQQFSSGYPSAVHNTRHVGKCIALLVSRLRETGNDDIHLIGFSLGSHVTNYVATNIRQNFTIPRITGLGLTGIFK